MPRPSISEEVDKAARGCVSDTIASEVAPFENVVEELILQIGVLESKNKHLKDAIKYDGPTQQQQLEELTKNAKKLQNSREKPDWAKRNKRERLGID